MRFFFDSCISENLAKAFTILENKNKIQHLHWLFPRDTPDTEWIAHLAREGDWVIVSGDMRITRNPEERHAWRESGLTAFFFSGKGITEFRHWKQVEVLAKWWPLITEEARDYRIGKQGSGYLMQAKSTKLSLL